MPDVFIQPKNKKEEAAPREEQIFALPSNAEPKNAGLFSSYRENPGGVVFQTEEADEKILLLLKRHFITNIPWIVVVVILISLPFVLNIIFTIAASPISLPARFITVLIFFYYLALFGYAFSQFITWFYNATLITQKRIVDIDFSELVFHDVAETKLSLLEDVNYTQSGFIRTLFNYGDVFAQTAGGKENIEALAVPQPAKAARTIATFIGKKSEHG